MSPAAFKKRANRNKLIKFAILLRKKKVEKL